MLAPVLDRVAAKPEVDAIVFTPLLWNLFFVSFFVYDWATLRRFHPVTWIGVIWFYAVWTLALLV